MNRVAKTLAALVGALVLGGSAAAQDGFQSVVRADWNEPAAGSPGYEKAQVYKYYQQVGHEHLERAIPRDPFGAERLQHPTPVEGFGHDGAPKAALNTDPYSNTKGIRLDDSYVLLREIEAGSYISEHQFVQTAGLTILPYQTPCLVLGTRFMADNLSNNSMTSDTVGVTMDVFLGTRYKSSYWKLGYFWDYHDHFEKMGFEVSSLLATPILDNLTLDIAMGFGAGADRFNGQRHPVTLRLRRVEIADNDLQVRIGHFLNERLQIGSVVNYSQYGFSDDEWGIGAFTAFHLGRVRLVTEIGGATEGWRGMVSVGWNWGAHTKDHPRDNRILKVDTVDWVTRASMRDVTTRLRESFTGPGPGGR